MKTLPVIPYTEFNDFKSIPEKHDGYLLSVRNHPDFGVWEEKFMNLPVLRIFEHKVNFTREVDVSFFNPKPRQVVSHCISVDGFINAKFISRNETLKLAPRTYHYMAARENDYRLTLSKSFHNVHIEIDQEHYLNLLSDSEDWSARLKENLIKSEFYYPGDFLLSQQMVNIIQEIFSSPLSGSLKKLLIEAKVYELLALQLGNSIQTGKINTSKRITDVMYAVRNFLDHSFLENHSLQGICRHFGINEFALKKGFKHTFNTTVFDYLLARRLDYSRELVINTTRTIHEIGTAVGYKYPNHFITAFKKKFEVTPKVLLSTC